MASVERQVFSALDNATENGYPPHNDSVEQIIQDLQSYDADLESRTEEELEPHVRRWLAANAE